MKRTISVILTVLLLVVSFTISSFASTQYVYIPITDFSIDMYTQDANQGGSITHYNSTVETRGPVAIGGVNYYGIKNTSSSFGGTGKTHNCLTYKIQNLSVKDEYNIIFTTSIRANVQYSIEVYLTDSNGQYLAVLGYDNRPAVSTQNLTTNFNFTLDGLNINTNQGVYLNILIEYGSQYSGNFEYLISAVTLTDLDDDTGFFESIIAWLRQLAQDILNTGTNIVNSISSSVSNLGTNISNWLSSLGTAITNKLQSVQSAITSAIDGIQNWFINLGQEIGQFFTALKNYLLYFQHPVTLNADGVPVDGQGQPIYTNPFSSALESVEDTLGSWIEAIDNFIDGIDDSADSVSTQLQLFKNGFERFSAGVPFIAGFLGFALVLFVIRKIVGR